MVDARLFESAFAEALWSLELWQTYRVQCRLEVQLLPLQCQPLPLNWDPRPLLNLYVQVRDRRRVPHRNRVDSFALMNYVHRKLDFSKISYFLPDSGR